MHAANRQDHQPLEIRSPRSAPSKSTLWLAAALLAGAQTVHAGAELKIDDNTSLDVGFGVRTSYTSLENGAPNGSSYSNDFEVEDARLFMSGTFDKIFKATFNTERQGGPAATGGDSVRVMDAIGQFEPTPVFNLWLGRTLPPSDRANLAGPFYVTPWSYPGVVSNYPNIAVGRDNGAMIWGKPVGGMIVYSAGIFNGHDRAAGLSDASDKLLYAGRLHINFWDVEPPPAYYLGEGYGGSKDILSFGVAGNFQTDGVGTAANPGDLKIWSIDGLFEKRFAAGVPTLEGAYYRYNLSGKVDCGSGEPGSPPCPSGDNIGGQVQGKAYMAVASFLIPATVGWGQFQPFVRYQRFNRDLSGTRNEATDVGVNYIVNGPNVKISAMYTRFDDSRLAPAPTSSNQFVVGMQFVY